MLKAGNIKDRKHAGLFGDYLFAKGIENQVDPGKDGDWEIWITDHARLDEARALLDEFLADPGDSRYAAAARQAVAKAEEQQKVQEAYEKRQRRSSDLFQKMGFKLISLTGLLIIVSILFTLFSMLGTRESVVSPLSIKDYKIRKGYIEFQRRRDLPQVRKGEVWRLVTPIFLHLSFFHILFNMWWLKDLGFQIERRSKWWYLLLMVLTIAVLSNFAQFMVTASPGFGGMSGVVYGLFGYIWIRSKYDPDCGLHISRFGVAIMIIWFFACMTGFVGPIANTAHAVGLGVGMAWGGAAAFISNLRRP